jgi:hypothetical protein
VVVVDDRVVGERRHDGVDVEGVDGVDVVGENAGELCGVGGHVEDAGCSSQRRVKGRRVA